MLTSSFSKQSLRQGQKPLGAYLVEAGLLSDAQVKVALADQHGISMTFGEILVTRGWVKEQTIEYLMQKVILPERKAKQKPDLESGLSKQKSKLTGSFTPPRERSMPSSVAASNSKVTVPAPTSKDESGVNWIG